MIPVHNILRSVYRLTDGASEKLNILTICRNTEKYIALLCATQHNFYILEDHPWNNLIEQRPPNLYSLDIHSPPIDCLICYDRAEQYAEAQTLSQRGQMPVVLVDLCSKDLIRPHNIAEDLQVKNPAELQRTPTFLVCSSPHIQRSWDSIVEDTSTIIPIGIDVNKFAMSAKPDQTIVTMDNNVHPQVGEMISTLLGDHYPIWPTDHENIQESNLIKSKYFINTNKAVTVKLLEAMAAKNIVIALRNSDTESFIEHSKTGMLIDSIDEIPAIIESFENNSDAQLQMANAAYDKIVTDHTLEPFVTQWQKVLETVRSSIYKPIT